jgi:hypothetical protein
MALAPACETQLNTFAVDRCWISVELTYSAFGRMREVAVSDITSR